MPILPWKKIQFQNYFSGLNHSVPFYPWVCFLIFGITNILLSYFPFSLESRLFLLILGFSLPMFLSILASSSHEKKEKLFEDLNLSFSVPLWGWMIFFIFALFLRLSHLTSMTQWPLYDEGMFAHFGLQLSQSWSFQPFYGPSQVPCLYFWILALAFKILGPSLSSLWLVPAVLSCMTVPLVFLGARQWMNNWVSTFLTWLWAFSFWPLYEGRFCVQYPLFVFWMWLGIYLLGLFLKTPQGIRKNIFLVLLSTITAGGFYISISWFLVAFTLLGGLYLGLPKKKVGLGSYFLWTTLLSSPWVLMAYRERFGAYVQGLWIFGAPIRLKDYLLNIAHYLSGIVWGIPKSFQVSSYGPHWGGLLNPLLGSLFFLGLIRIWSFRENLGARFLAVLLVFLLAPAFCTNNLEYYRIIQVLPVLLIVIILGAILLLRGLPQKYRGLVLAVLLIFSLAMDLYHLYGPCRCDAAPELSPSLKSDSRFLANEILNREIQPKGWGLVFDQFIDRPTDASLALATYRFNALINPLGSFDQARWMAVIANINYQPFLTKIFPSGKIYWLSKDSPPQDGGLMLFVAPLTQDSKPILRRWVHAANSLEGVYELSSPWDWKSFEEIYPVFKDDRFLESFFWMNLADQRFTLGLAHGFIGMTNSFEASNGRTPSILFNETFLKNIIEETQNAAQRGYPAANIYFRLGNLWYIAGDNPQAIKMYRRAINAPLDFTQSKAGLLNIPVKAQSEHATKSKF
jgi:hypothetical protein